ncbi:DNA polymerase delta subunit 3 [Osmerus eperlanus]|uniref:DNA polymerase delta subunit 3 n=1 Tax=Osmerus eperlanus TaxID=29151 RepID=UPI002E0DE9D6
MDEMYLDNIDEYVNDHNKIVTYKWLSLTLGVHVNLAKQMLFHYLEQKRRESSTQLHATYLVSGKFVENGQASHKVSVVREDQLEDVKSKLSLTVSVHVYSVQKAELKDSGPLYSVDYDAVKENIKNCSRYSAIHCASAIPIETPERTQAPPPDTEQEVKSVMNGQTSLPAKPTAKPKGIMGMFGNKNAPKNEKEIKSEKKEDTPAHVPAIEISKNKPVSKTNAMSNFFGKQAAKKPADPVKQEEVAEPSPVESKPTSPPVKQTQLEMEEPEDVLEKEHGSKTKRLNHSDGEEEKTESQKKKRRRIKKPQPDSSDDEVIPDSPRQQDVRKPSSSRGCQVKREPVSCPDEKSPKKRKRRRVLKAHTFQDEEGCIVTEKAFESESYSETEDEVQASKPTSAPATLSTGKKEEKKSQKKSTPTANKGTKQASIMGFFQKK